MNLKAQFNAPSLSASVGNVTIQGGVDVRPLAVTENGTYSESGVAYSPVTVTVKQWDDELTAILDGSATELRDLPIGLTKIKPYAFYLHDRILPSAYQKVEWIESPGNAYINTGCTATPNIVATIDGEWLSYSSGFPTMLGTEDPSLSGGRINVLFGRGTGGFYTECFSIAPTFIYSSHSADSLRHIFEITVNSSSLKLNIDGTSDTLNNGTFAQHTNDPMFLFARGRKNGNPSASTTFRLYSFSLVNAGVLRWNGIPCYRKSDGIAGLYNIVDNSFHPSEGASNFLKGEDVIETNNSVTEADLTVNEIGAYAFFNNELSSLTLRAPSVVTIGDHALDGTPIADGTGTIYVPAELVSAYETQYPGWAFDAIS